MTRPQLLARGLTTGSIGAHLAAGRWQRPIPGIYVTFTGPLPALTRYWVALLHAGGDAALSHETAGALWRLVPEQHVSPVHVTVPFDRGVRSRRGIVVHRTRSTPIPTGSPPRTPVGRTAVDLCAAAHDPFTIAAVLGRVAQHHRWALDEVHAMVLSRRTLRNRAEILAVITDAAGGTHSALERLFLVDVERAHGLPPSERQRAVGKTRQDVHFREYSTTVELDGRVVHRPVNAAFRDMLRDNSATVRSEATLRYGWYDVRHRPCAVAAEMAFVLRSRGWNGKPTRCGPNCRL